MPVLRSIIALVAGFAIMAFLMLALVTIAAWAIGARAGAPFSPSMLGANIALFAVAALGGGYACAALAPGRPRAHAAVLAVMILAMTLSMVAQPPPGAPRWFPATLAVLGPLSAALGGALYSQRRKRGHSPVPT